MQELERANAALTDKVTLYEKATKFRAAPDALPETPPVYTLEGHRGPVLRIAFHPQLLLLVSGSADGLILVWDYETGARLNPALRGHTATVHDLDFDPSGRWLVSSSADTSVKLWDCGVFSCAKTFHGHDGPVLSVRFLQSGDGFLSCSGDGTIKIWNLGTGYCLQTFSGAAEWMRVLTPVPSSPKAGEPVRTCQFVTGGHDRQIRVWDVAHPEPLRAFSAHDHVIESLCFGNTATHAAIAEHEGGVSSAAVLLFSASRDGTAKMSTNRVLSSLAA